MANGRVVVPAPAFTPSQYGLLSVARDMTGEFDSHWAAGITYQPLCAGTSSTFDECLVVTGVGASPEPAAKAATFTSQRRAATPFTVISRKDCSAPTFWNDAPDEVAEALTEGEGWQVERAFWTGNVDSQSGINHPHLQANAAIVVDLDTLQTAATVVTGVALDIISGLGLIEQALADCYQGQGVIHVPASLGASLAAWGLIHLDGGRFVTTNGNLVAIGRGYTGTSPAGVAATPTATWIYATGAVFYARSPLREFSRTEMFDRNTNTVDALAERTYVVGWDCCHLAIPINMTQSSSVSSGAVTVTNLPATYPQPTAQRSTLNTLLTAGADRNIPAGRRSYTLVVTTKAGPGSPSLDGVEIPAIGSYTYSAPNNDTLAAAAVLTAPGDVVLVMELF